MTVTKFRKKPLEVEAIQYVSHGNFHERYKGQLPDWVWGAFESGALKPTNGDDPLRINAAVGHPVLEPGYWLIRGENGELCPLDPDTFEATYDPVHDGAQAA